MIKSLTFLSFLSITAATSLAATYEEYQAKSPQSYWEAKGGIGFSSSGPLLAGATTTNLNLNDGNNPHQIATSKITEKSVSASPLIYLNLQRTFVLDQAPLYALSFGLSFYYQQLQSTGNSFETGPGASGEPSANYTFTSKQMLPMLEIQWTPILLWHCLAPFIVVGGGLNYAKNAFNVVLTPEGQGAYAPGNANSTQLAPAADIGIGLNLMFNERWGMDLRYVYLKSFSQKITGDISTSPVTFGGATNSLLLSAVYRFGIKN
jgi:hypothetical protein